MWGEGRHQQKNFGALYHIYKLDYHRDRCACGRSHSCRLAWGLTNRTLMHLARNKQYRVAKSIFFLIESRDHYRGRWWYLLPFLKTILHDSVVYTSRRIWTLRPAWAAFPNAIAKTNPNEHQTAHSPVGINFYQITQGQLKSSWFIHKPQVSILSYPKWKGFRIAFCTQGGNILFKLWECLNRFSRDFNSLLKFIFTFL